jgi:hypothetical protein
MNFLKKLSKVVFDEDYKKAKEIFGNILCHPNLPEEIVMNIKNSAEMSVKEGKERYELYAFKGGEVYTFLTETLEKFGVIECRKENEVRINLERLNEIILPYKLNGFKILEHHTHISYSLQSKEDLIGGIKRGADLIAISLPMLNYITQLYFDVEKMRELNIEDLIKAQHKLESEFLVGRKWMDLLSPKS